MKPLNQINKEYEEIIQGQVKEPYRSRKSADLLDDMATYQQQEIKHEKAKIK
ncbi:hypothetical protein [Niallia sp. 03133]|uniref:hypothetical protein n=1 Tax=Niallia sp. 03133 TaxID=3458060 RepID=UPI004044BCD3